MGYINIWASKMYELPNNHQLAQRLINDNIGLVHMAHISNNGTHVACQNSQAHDKLLNKIISVLLN
jgi:hypothetical protein